jgi:hypothetical protein
MSRDAAQMLETANHEPGRGSGPGWSWINSGRRRRHYILAGLLGLAVFAVDAFTEVRGAVAVLYVLVMLLASDALSRRGIVLLASACAGLTVFAFLTTHGLHADVSATLHFGIALAAIGITAALLLRDQASKQSLMEANAALARSERQYRSIFEQARISLWEQDFSEVKTLLAALRQQGVRDLAAYARHPFGARDERWAEEFEIRFAVREAAGSGGALITGRLLCLRISARTI